jgi:hypothetical protein
MRLEKNLDINCAISKEVKMPMTGGQCPRFVLAPKRSVSTDRMNVAQFPEAIYVLHAFEKKTQRTPKQDIDAARSAYAQIQEERKKSGKRANI